MLKSKDVLNAVIKFTNDNAVTNSMPLIKDQIKLAVEGNRAFIRLFMVTEPGGRANFVNLDSGIKVKLSFLAKKLEDLGFKVKYLKNTKSVPEFGKKTLMLIWSNT
jgi:hypothetical protein